MVKTGEGRPRKLEAAGSVGCDCDGLASETSNAILFHSERLE
jgi:hypothetical protein